MEKLEMVVDVDPCSKYLVTHSWAWLSCVLVVATSQGSDLNLGTMKLIQGDSMTRRALRSNDQG